MAAEQGVGGEMLSVKEVLDLVPQQEPFRFIDEILELDEDHIVATYTFREEADFYRGHFLFSGRRFYRRFLPHKHGFWARALCNPCNLCNNFIGFSLSCFLFLLLWLNFFCFFKAGQTLNRLRWLFNRL